MKEAADTLKNAAAAAIKSIESILSLEEPLIRASQLIADCLLSGNKILACGNGGSAADAADFTTEFACKFVTDRRPYPALNLAQGGSLLTAVGNDYDFKEIFARQVRGFGKPGDVLVAISTSGRSENIRRALEEARSQALKTIALLARQGGNSTGIAELDLLVS